MIEAEEVVKKEQKKKYANLGKFKSDPFLVRQSGNIVRSNIHVSRCLFSICTLKKNI
jgi:hypothetical protein